MYFFSQVFFVWFHFRQVSVSLRCGQETSLLFAGSFLAHNILFISSFINGNTFLICSFLAYRYYFYLLGCSQEKPLSFAQLLPKNLFSLFSCGRGNFAFIWSVQPEINCFLLLGGGWGKLYLSARLWLRKVVLICFHLLGCGRDNLIVFICSVVTKKNCFCLFGCGRGKLFPFAQLWLTQFFFTSLGCGQDNLFSFALLGMK